ncbi:uncharacterized protein LOC113351755 [Papaver somniferum]|uniref:uncharacterized protein LOC113351755 n=1 Tax=Papaver somniferum TaxID=3469 RepID=UPI000E6FFD09|nr:uncharacterized protein LOC113351755 [Papaver somniferum]
MDIDNTSSTLNFPNSKLHNLNQVGSDHIPIMLVSDAKVPYFWKPFKFFLTWLNDESCATVIANAWNSSFNGSPAFQLVSKLHITRKMLSLWNKEHFGNIIQKVDNLQKELLYFNRNLLIQAQMMKLSALTDN